MTVELASFTARLNADVPVQTRELRRAFEELQRTSQQHIADLNRQLQEQDRT